MTIAYVFQPERGATDALLSDVATALAARGVPLAGAVQSTTGCGVNHCDMDLQVLPDGPVIRISQNLGAGSTGCRLDTGALEGAVMEAAARMPGARLLIVNKFGKHEAEGRGFRDLVAQAVGAGLPVLIGVNSMNRAAFETFADGMAQELPAQMADVVGWAMNAVAEAVTE